MSSNLCCCLWCCTGGWSCKTQPQPYHSKQSSNDCCCITFGSDCCHFKIPQCGIDCVSCCDCEPGCCHFRIPQCGIDCKPCGGCDYNNSVAPMQFAPPPPPLQCMDDRQLYPPTAQKSKWGRLPPLQPVGDSPTPPSMVDGLRHRPKYH